MEKLETPQYHTKKKTTLYKERSEEKRLEFKEALAKLNLDQVVYLDEAGVDNRLFREYARAPKGQKITADIPGKKRERVSIIGGLINKTFIAPFTFQGGCNRDVFNTWLERTLLPDLPKGTTVIMDNAAFHKSPRTRELIEKAGCHLLFLPTYSPDLNPIEHWWHKIKSLLKPLIQNASDNLIEILLKCLSTI